MKTITTSEKPPVQGYYPVPSKNGFVNRLWDGQAWTPITKSLSGFKGFSTYKRDWYILLRWPWLALIILLPLLFYANHYLKSLNPNTIYPAGWQLLMPVVEVIGAAIPIYIICVFLNNRLRFKQLDNLHKLFFWGVISGIVALGISFLSQWGLLHIIPKHLGVDFWWVAGPTEEVSKLLIPIILWFCGMFRVPRQGFLLLLITAATFGILEALQHSITLSYAGGGGQVNASEFMHILLSCFVAAAAWQSAWKKPSLFTGTTIIVILIAVLLHGIMDESAGLKITFVGIASLVIAFFLLKFTARQLVPPDMVANVSPGWRPEINSKQ